MGNNSYCALNVSLSHDSSGDNSQLCRYLAKSGIILKHKVVNKRSPPRNLAKTQVVVAGPLDEARAGNGQHLQIIPFSGVHLCGFWLKIYTLARRRKELNVTVLVQMNHYHFLFQQCWKQCWEPALAEGGKVQRNVPCHMLPVWPCPAATQGFPWVVLIRKLQQPRRSHGRSGNSSTKVSAGELEEL